MTATEGLAAQIGIVELIAPVLLANEGAGSFYEACGYVTYGRLLARPVQPLSVQGPGADRRSTGAG